MIVSRASITLLIASSLAFVGCDEKGSDAGAKPASATTAGAATATAKAPAAPKPAGATVASCNIIKAEGMCREWGEKNISAAGEDSLKNACTGEFKLQACPSDKRVGSCKTPEGTKVFYNDGPLPWAADKAEKSCKEGVPAGEWKGG